MTSSRNQMANAIVLEVLDFVRPSGCRSNGSSPCRCDPLCGRVSETHAPSGGVAARVPAEELVSRASHSSVRFSSTAHHRLRAMGAGRRGHRASRSPRKADDDG